ncbi:MAG: hypothetical protein QXR57_02805 [Metallosphaera sp.]|uniref:hypothetical protein n=1 Tax=Metallosphaera TaxID=41980 RepID=UPI00064F2D1C|nr:hypothetical protein [Metallosphaera cuprina]
MSELQKLILAHIYKFGPDNPWYMSRRLMGNSGWAPKYDPDEVERACYELEQKKLLVRFQGSLKRSVTSSVKPWLKVKAKEMGTKPKGIYYDLTKEGRKIASQLAKDLRKTGS